MTVRRGDNGMIVLDGVCPVEDAEPLLQMLQTMPAAGIDWTQCRQLHTAVLQLDRGVGQGPDRTMRRRLDRAMAGTETAPKRDSAPETGQLGACQWNKSVRRPFTLF